MESQYKSQLKSIVLNLRHVLEGRYDDAGVWHPGDLEEQLAALGVRRDREAMPLEQLSHLSEDDRRARQMVDAFIQSNLKSGPAREEAIHEFLQESAYTWANRLIAPRCMEARGLIDEVILQKENHGGRSLKHHRLARQAPEACAGEDDGLYAVLVSEFADRAEELPFLFHPDETGIPAGWFPMVQGYDTVPALQEEKTFDSDRTAGELAEVICVEAEAMMTDALKCACTVWWKSFDSHVLKPVSEKIRDAKKELQSLKEESLDPENDFKAQSDIKRKMNALKSDIKAWQKELALKTGQGKTVRDTIESWSCPEALTWEPWLTGQDLYDQISSLNARRPPPQTVQEFIRRESFYQPDINAGVGVNIAPLQEAGLLAADVLAAEDMDKAIADRAAWRDDERRWCREGKLPKPGWWD